MKVAVASLKEDKESEISREAGRSPYYLVFSDGKLEKAVSNPFQFGGGAGFAVARMLKDLKVDCVVAGRFGPNMLSALKEYGIKHYELEGKVKDALEKVSS